MFIVCGYNATLACMITGDCTHHIHLNGLDFELLLPAVSIQERVKAIGGQISNDYAHTTPVVIGVLNGSFLFMADVVKQIAGNCEISFVKLSSYHGNTTSSQQVITDIDIHIKLEGREIIVVEDIIETGNTLQHLIKMLEAHHPTSIAVCTLLLKPHQLANKPECIKYIGFEIPDDFVVGYGLDYQELGRNLKDIYRKI